MISHKGYIIKSLTFWSDLFIMLKVVFRKNEKQNGFLRDFFHRNSFAI